MSVNSKDDMNYIICIFQFFRLFECNGKGINIKNTVLYAILDFFVIMNSHAV